MPLGTSPRLRHTQQWLAKSSLWAGSMLGSLGIPFSSPCPKDSFDRPPVGKLRLEGTALPASSSHSSQEAKWRHSGSLDQEAVPDSHKVTAGAPHS